MIEWKIVKYSQQQHKRVFVVMAVHESTSHLYASVFMHYLARYYGIQGSYTVDYLHFGLPISKYLTNAGLKSYFPESLEYEKVHFFDLTMKNVHDVMEYVEKYNLIHTKDFYRPH